MVKTALKWAAWLFSAFTFILLLFGSLAYLFGNIKIMGARWGTYYLFAGYGIQFSILLVLLYFMMKDCCKEK